MKTLFAILLLSAVSVVAQVTNVTFAWEASEHATGYRFYDVQGTNRTLLGSTSNLTFVVSNWNVTLPRTVAVTATNMLGESTNTVLAVPPAATPPQNLKPVPLSIVSPVPGVVEVSQDLVDWSQRIKLAAGPTNSIQLTWVKYPTEPMLFMRSRTLQTLRLPPLPITPQPP